MTVSRVVNELISAGVARLDQRGRTRWLLMDRPPAETWELIKPRLRTPIKKQLWVRMPAAFDHKDTPLAGLSALAYYTHLADPAMPVYAVGVERLRSRSFKNVEQTPEPLPGGCQLQVWNYAPIPSAKSRDKKAVDPLSLSLSFPDYRDERIELALEELKGRFPW